jgi:hypothetical protein
MATVNYERPPEIGMKEAFALGLPRIFYKALSSANLSSQTRALRIFLQELLDPLSELFPRDYLLHSFPLFTKLPIELRLKIWNLLPRKRTLLVDVDKYNCLRSLTPSPVAFYVNRESRREIQRHYATPYTLASYPPEIPQPALHQHHFDPKVDTVHITAEYFNLHGNFMDFFYPEHVEQEPNGDLRSSDAVDQNLIFDTDHGSRQSFLPGETLSTIRHLEIEMGICSYLFGTRHEQFEYDNDDNDLLEFFSQIPGLQRFKIFRDWTYPRGGMEQNFQVVDIHMARRPFRRYKVYHERRAEVAWDQVTVESRDGFCGDWVFEYSYGPEA